ncbi:MAG: prenyltransferase/squalene oxidase repeat-containing protein [Anaerolineae bacterium]
MKYRLAIVLALVAALALGAVLPALADASMAVQWLQSLQREDGGFGSQGSTLSETSEVIYALAAAGQDVAGLKVSGKSPLDYLAAHITEATNIGTKAKVAMAVSAAGANASSVGGANLIDEIERSLTADGFYGGAEDMLTSHVYAMLALASAGRPVAASAVAWLRNQQAPGGGWAWNGSKKPQDVDSNTTALALQALIAAGVPKDDPAVQLGLQYLATVQNDDGGFTYQKPSPYGTDTDANSTAVCLQALYATGQALATWAKADGKTPLDALAALQRNDGAFAWQAAFGDANLLATAQAVPALLGKPYPIAITKVAAATEVTQAPTATAAPAQVLPVTGAAQPDIAPTLMLAASALAVAGFLLRRKLAA